MTRATQPLKGTSDWMSARHPTARKSRRLETITRCYYEETHGVIQRKTWGYTMNRVHSRSPEMIEMSSKHAIVCARFWSAKPRSRPTTEPLILSHRQG
jgi:hypothetical protein